MAEFIKVGSTFDVTCDCSPLTGVDGFSNPRVYYRRPDGKQGYITPDTVTDSTMVARITPTENPLTGRAGTWQFYPYLTGTGTIVYRGQEATLVVHPEYRQV